jgi:ABC-type multidrug transport system ATPase subunit
VEALKNLDLQVPQKSIFAFLGANWEGKTTTIMLGVWIVGGAIARFVPNGNG